MYNLLVVDDEEIAVRGIVEGIDWEAEEISGVFTAYDAAEAREIFRQHAVHVMISDIEMPSETGIDLLEWVNEHSPQTETIFLTGHADFRYAQQAIQLSSFDYLLKPIDHEQLKACVRKALEKIRQREQEAEFLKTYEYYYEQWNRQLPLLVERFWQDVIHHRLSPTPGQLEPMLKLYGMELSADSPVLPILISVEEWKQDWSARDEEIMTYALKNAAVDILLQNGAGHVIQDVHGMLFALFYEPPGLGETELEARCREYVRKAGELLYSVVSCYIGEPAPVRELPSNIALLAEMERHNVHRTGEVFRASAYNRQPGRSAYMPNFGEWVLLIENGREPELMRRIDEAFAAFTREPPDRAAMMLYVSGLTYEVFQALLRRGLSPGDVYPDGGHPDMNQVMRTLAALKNWTAAFAAKALQVIAQHSEESSNTIIRVKRFIEAHLHDDLNREAIAGHVYLNPAYLSRLFRRETGMSLTDYIVERRMEKVKEALARTNVKISDIALSVGYANFSHFSKQFKRSTGLTPQEYRKKYQVIE
jgi:Response regulator containing CheY-like receiver domain and AraC-type DNA-binding domain